MNQIWSITVMITYQDVQSAINLSIINSISATTSRLSMKSAIKSILHSRNHVNSNS